MIAIDQCFGRNRKLLEKSIGNYSFMFPKTTMKIQEGQVSPARATSLQVVTQQSAEQTPKQKIEKETPHSNCVPRTKNDEFFWYEPKGAARGRVPKKSSF